ncbi:MAG: peptidase M14 family protein, partial [Candidatus Aminicenantes bacterium]|nr:peptidase M14 family protein [Candidatus Aminicenantes bacterium]
VENPLKDVERTDFFCPGSVLAVEVDTSHPIGYGMREKSAVFFRRSPAFRLTPTTEQTEAKVVVAYPDRNPLMSGWLLGGEHLYNKAAVVDVPVGEGRVILIGFRAQHRAQPHRTFKILFNAIYYGSVTSTRLP